MSKAPAFFAAIFLCVALTAGSEAQTVRQPAITRPIDPGATVVLQGSKHQLVQPRFNVGAVDPGLKMDRVIVMLAPPKEVDDDLQAFLGRQQDKTSSDYHHWLTPDEFGQRFGAVPQDIATVKSWLEGQGMTVTAVAKSGRWMEVSGTSGQIEHTFQTQMRQFQVDGKMHIANATDISIPAALSPVLRGVVSLNDFHKKPLASKPVPVKANANGTYSAVTPNATSTTGSHALSPGDYAIIYNINPIYTSNITGTGTTIGLVARSDIDISDYISFRQVMNLPVTSAANVLTLAPDPGFDPNSDDSVEATLDAQWAGAVAPGASIKVIVSASSTTTDGVDLSSAYAVDHNLVDVLSVSFGECEAGLGPAANAFYNSLWQQASAQGMSVFVSSGDSGSAGCDNPNTNGLATHGLAVSGIASTTFNTAVGGTQFADAGNVAFWNSAPALVSATGYIPEAVWNESCNPNIAGSPCAGKGFSLFAGSGGQSGIYAKPVWQTGFPAVDTTRDIPDVSLTAAIHDGYLICLGGICGSNGFDIIGGTSASSPSFAGIMALVDESLGGRQGLANYALYRLAKGASASCSSSARTPGVPAPAGCIFNDVTSGNNSVPGQPGFSATANYDLATGLGSVNVTNLIGAWKLLSAAATTTTLSSTSGSTISAAHGIAIPLTVNVTNPNTPAPSGAVVLLSSTNGSTPVESVALAASSSTTGTFDGTINDLPGGTYSLTARYPGDSVTAPSTSGPLTINITPESSATVLHAFQVSSGNLPGNQSNSFAYGDNIFLQANVTAASTHGVPTGNVAYVDTSVAPPFTLGGAFLNVKGEAQVLISPDGGFGTVQVLNPGTHIVKTTYTGDASFTAGTQGSVTLTIGKGTPNVIMGNGSFTAGFPGTISASVHPLGPIVPTGTIQLLDGGVPFGGPITLDASGVASVQTTFQIEGTHSFTANYAGDAVYNAGASAPASVFVGAPYGMAAAPTGNLSATVPAGQTAFYNLAILDTNVGNPNTNNFSGTVTFSCSGLPAGSNCSFTPSSIALIPNQAFPFTVSVTTSASAALHPAFPFRGLPVVFAGVLALAISLKGNRKHLWQIGLVAVLALGISACGGGGGATTPTPTPVPTPTPSTQTNFVVTATSGTHTSTINLQLTVTH